MFQVEVKCGLQGFSEHRCKSFPRKLLKLAASSKTIESTLQLLFVADNGSIDHCDRCKHNKIII